MHGETKGTFILKLISLNFIIKTFILSTFSLPQNFPNLSIFETTKQTSRISSSSSS